MLPFELTKDTPYLALSGELWSVFYEYFNRNWSWYKGFLLYVLLRWVSILSLEHLFGCNTVIVCNKNNWYSFVFRVSFQYKDRVAGYMNSYYKDKTVVRRSYLHNGNSYAGEITSLCWEHIR